MDNKILIPDGYTARIEGNEIILTPNEKEDDRIRDELIKAIVFFSNRGLDRQLCKDFLAYIGRHKGPKVDIDKLRKDIYQSGYNDGYRQGKEYVRKNAQFVNNLF